MFTNHYQARLRSRNMNIHQAIEILNDLALTGEVMLENDDIDAIKLGIEAMQFIERWRSKAEIQPFPILRSETID